MAMGKLIGKVLVIIVFMVLYKIGNWYADKRNTVSGDGGKCSMVSVSFFGIRFLLQLSFFFMVSACAPEIEKKNYTVDFSKVEEVRNGANVEQVAADAGEIKLSIDLPNTLESRQYRVFVIGDGLSMYQYSFSNANCETAEKSELRPPTQALEFTVGRLGSFYLCVEGFRADGTSFKPFSKNFVLDSQDQSFFLTQLPSEVSGLSAFDIGVYATQGSGYLYAFQKGDNCASYKSADLSEKISISIKDEGFYSLCVKVVDAAGLASEPITHKWRYAAGLNNVTFAGLPDVFSLKESYSVTFSSETPLDSFRMLVVAGEEGRCNMDEVKNFVRNTGEFAIGAEDLVEGRMNLCFQGLSDVNGLTEIVKYSWMQGRKAAFPGFTNLPPAITIKTAFKPEPLDVSSLGKLGYAVVSGDEVNCERAFFDLKEPGLLDFNITVGLGDYTFCAKGETLDSKYTALFAHSFSVIDQSTLVPPTINLPSSLVNEKNVSGITVDSIYAGISHSVFKGVGSCDSVTFGQVLPANQPFSVQLVKGDGTYTICVRGVLEGGDTTAPSNATIILDTIAPTFNVVTPLDPTISESAYVTGLESSEADASYRYKVLAGDVPCENGGYSEPLPVAAGLNINFVSGKNTLCIFTVDLAVNTSRTQRLLTTLFGEPEIVQLKNLSAGGKFISNGITVGVGATLFGLPPLKFKIDRRSLASQQCSSNPNRYDGDYEEGVLYQLSLPNSGTNERICLMAFDGIGRHSEPKSALIEVLQ